MDKVLEMNKNSKNTFLKRTKLAFGHIFSSRKCELLSNLDSRVLRDIGILEPESDFQPPHGANANLAIKHRALSLGSGGF